MEALTYNSNGQPGVVSLHGLSPSHKRRVPEHRVRPCVDTVSVHEIGRRGIGESGCVGAPAAIVAAIQDALPPEAPFLMSLPVHPEQLLAIIKEHA